MTSPEELARKRLLAIAALEAQLASHVSEAERILYEGLLARLSDLHADPGLLPVLLAEYTNTVLLPLAGFYAQQLLELPGLNVGYFEQLDVAGYQALRAPLADFLRARLGVDAAGAVVPGGYLALLQGDTTVAKQVLTYAYRAQASGAGLNAYRDGLNSLILGGGAQASGIVQGLYKSSGDDFAQADRALQSIAAKELGLTAFLYQGGLIDSSRPFCVARNGRVFVDFEIAKFGTSADKYSGYYNKSEGLFSGKPEPYNPMIDCGGYSCRHHWHAVSSITALRMRPDLRGNAKGELYLFSETPT